MTDNNKKTHIPLPKETAAFYCGNCGSVSLDQNNICKPSGKIIKADWCGSKDLPLAKTCENRVHVNRFSCKSCGKSSMNESLLCEPDYMALP